MVISHADVVNLLSAMGREYDYSPDDVWAMYTSYAFDVSVSGSGCRCAGAVAWWFWTT